MQRVFLYLFTLVTVFLLGLYVYVDLFFMKYSVRTILMFVMTSLGNVENHLLMHFLYFCVFPVLLISNILFFLPKIVHFFRKSFDERKCNFFLVCFVLLMFIEIVWGYNRKFELIKFFFLDDYGDFYEKNYIESKKENIKFPIQKKNLIYISLESMERSFANEEVYGGSLIKAFEELETNEVYFSNYQDGFDTTPTKPSTVAILNGLPDSSYKMLLTDTVSVPKSYSLGKIFQDAGYKTESIIGTNGKFTSLNSLFYKHGIAVNIDREYIKKHYPKEFIDGTLNQYSDQVLFKIVKSEILKLEQSSQNFFLLIQTIDTHANDLPKVNFEKKYDNTYYNIIDNTSKLTVDFIKWFKTRSEFGDTVIIVAGDHLRRDNLIPYPIKRSIYNLFINSAIKPKNTNRTFTQIDMFPTILEAMGVKIKGHRLGLGTSVFSDEPTLAERFSPEYLAKELVKRSKIYESLW